MSTELSISTRDLARFWGKVNCKGPTPDQQNPHYTGLGNCWTWLGGTRGKGYGAFRLGKSKVSTHRLSYFMANGMTDKCILHRCDNPRCVRPDHLFEGTDSDNAKDRAAKNRGNSLCGDSHHARQRPWVMARGEQHGSKTKPDRVPRGDKTGARKHPELLPRGEKHGNAKLKENDVVAIRRMYGDGETQSSIGQSFGVSQVLVGRIVNHKIWKHVA